MKRIVGLSLLLAAISSLSACCDKDKLPERMRALYSEDAHERSQAAWKLASCGSAASKAVPRLAELLYDPNTGVQSAAAFALNKIDTPEARAIMEEVESRKRR